MSFDNQECEKIYRAKVGYFERPVSVNINYDFEVVQMKNPGSFTVKVKGSFTSEFEGRLKSLLKAYSDDFLTHEKTANAVDSDLLYKGMPVLANLGSEGEADVSSLARGEVLTYKGNEIDVRLVDQGGVFVTTLDQIFWVTVDILRIPKLGFACQLAMVEPPTGATWQEDINYKADFIGKQSQTLTFLDYYLGTKMFEVAVEVDKVNLALKYFISLKAQPIRIRNVEKKVGDQVTVPSADYTSWIGLKVDVFGLKVFLEEDDGKLKCVLQPTTANAIQDWIAEFIAQNLDKYKKIPFDKKPGTMCLAPFGVEVYFRAVIENRVDGEEERYLVKYPDYLDTATVAASDLLKLPDELSGHAEGSIVCQMTDFLMSGCKDVEKLRSLVENKDLFAVVDAVDSSRFGPDLLVSLFEPTDDFSGADKPFSEIFNTERPRMITAILQPIESVKDDLVRLFLQPQLPKPNICKSGAMICVVNSPSSIWIQFAEERDLAARISAEMTQFYANGGFDEDNEEELVNNMKVGMYVAARLVDDEDELRYRAKILRFVEDGKLFLRYFDYGNTNWADLSQVTFLDTYFAKDRVMAIEMELKSGEQSL